MQVTLMTDSRVLIDTLAFPWTALTDAFGSAGAWRFPLLLYGIAFLLLGVPTLWRVGYVGKGWQKGILGWLGLALRISAPIFPAVWVLLALPANTRGSRIGRSDGFWLVAAGAGVLGWWVRSPAALAATGVPPHLLSFAGVVWFALTVPAILWAIVTAIRSRLGWMHGSLLLALCALDPILGPAVALRALKPPVPANAEMAPQPAAASEA